MDGARFHAQILEIFTTPFLCLFILLLTFSVQFFWVSLSANLSDVYIIANLLDICIQLREHGQRALPI